MKIYTKKILGLLCFVVFLLAASVALTALAAGDLAPEVLTNSKYLNIHNTSDDYKDTGGNSSISVKDTNGSNLSPGTDSNGNLTYSNIPEGAAIKINYAFHLEDGDGTNLYDYSQTKSFTITLPEGISFDAPTGDLAKIIATDADEHEWQMGTWTITNNIVTVTFTEGIANHSNMWGKIQINGTFDASSDGSIPDAIMNLGNQSIKFTREQPPAAKINLEKSGVYDAVSNQIIWSIKAGSAGIDLTGYTLADTFSSNQTYVSGSLIVGDTAADNKDLTTDASSISYTFPANTSGIQTITYRTTPTSYAGANGTSTFENTAIMNKDAQAASDSVKADVTNNWINKEGSYSPPSGATDDTIRLWTVTVNMPDGGSFSEAQIIDTLPAGLKLITDSSDYPVQIKLNDSNAVTIPKDQADANGKYTSESGIFVYTFPSSAEKIAGKAILTYYTKVTDRDSYLNNNGAVNFTNSAQFIWKGMLTDSTPPSDTVTVGIVGDGGLISKSADGQWNYDHTKTNFIHWTIMVNKNKVTMPKDSSVTDNIPDGQKLVINGDHPLTIKKESSEEFKTTSSSATGNLTSSDSFEKNYRYTLNSSDSFADSYTIDYYTQITDLSNLYQNGNISFGNSTVLARGVGGAESISSTGNKSFYSQLLAKYSAGYNYADHTAKWQIVVNQNQLPLTNAQLSDTLPDGMNLVIDDDHPFQILKLGESTSASVSPTISEDKKSFTYDFTDYKDNDKKINTQYIITFYTKLLDSTLITKWDNSQEFKNNAELKADEISEPVVASSSVWINNPILTKSYSYDFNNPSDRIDWTAVLNKAGLDLKDAVVTDVLDPGLQLDTNSLKLYEAVISQYGGTVTKSENLVDSKTYTVEWPTADNNNTLKISLPDGKKAYYLEFATNILSDNLNFNNNINLTGDPSSPKGDATAGQFSITDLYSKAGSGSNKLTVYKDDGNGKAVAGATYQLLNVNKQPIKKSGNVITTVTDENGKAVFDKLPSWVFYAQEVNAPDGYLINPEIIGGDRLTGEKTVNTSDQPAVGDIEFAKTSTSGALLSGGEFTLTGTDDANKTFTRIASSVDGKVTFKSIPLGNYIIQETKAPNGYYLTDEKITASVKYNDAKTGVTITISPDKLANLPIPPVVVPNGSIELLKTDTDGIPLAGAKFGLYTTSGSLIKAIISETNGNVAFADIPIGNYLIREISAPDGYVLSATEATASITNDNLNVKASPYTITNVSKAELLIGSIELLKTNRDNEPLSGAVFGLYNSSGTLIKNVTSNNEGLIIFDAVPLGDYIIKEITPPSGYSLSATEITASVTADSLNVKTSPYTVVNDRSATPILSGSIELKKIDDNFNPLADAEFGLYDADGTLIKTAVSNNEGLVRFAEVPFGSYTVKEVTPPDGYTLSETTSIAIVSADSTEIKASPYMIVNYNDTNLLQHGSIQVTKVDAQSKAQLPDAVFTLYNEAGAAVQTSTSDSSGLAAFAAVSPGSYTIREITAPTGYLLSDEVIRLTVEANKSYEYTYANTSANATSDGNSTGNYSPENKSSGANQTGTQKNTLPQTGGFWDSTTLGITGAALIGLGIVLNYLNRKKMKREKNEKEA